MISSPVPRLRSLVTTDEIFGGGGDPLTFDTVYQAPSDGFINAYLWGEAGDYFDLYVGEQNPPDVLCGYLGEGGNFIFFAIEKGEYFKFARTVGPGDTELIVSWRPIR